MAAILLHCTTNEGTNFTNALLNERFYFSKSPIKKYCEHRVIIPNTLYGIMYICSSKRCIKLIIFKFPRKQGNLFLITVNLHWKGIKKAPGSIFQANDSRYNQRPLQKYSWWIFLTIWTWPYGTILIHSAPKQYSLSTSIRQAISVLFSRSIELICIDLRLPLRALFIQLLIRLFDKHLNLHNL